jgi:PadR family transcriptional regulator, regulatory protein PadR
MTPQNDRLAAHAGGPLNLAQKPSGRSIRHGNLKTLTRLPSLPRYIGMKPITGDALRGHLETLILSVLERGEAHGFDILRRMEEAGSGALRLKEGSLYPALYRLEGAGLVKAAWEDDSVTRRGPRRRIYHLTTKGTRRLAEGRQEWKLFVGVLGGILGVPA